LLYANNKRKSNSELQKIAAGGDHSKEDFDQNVYNTIDLPDVWDV
jgi:hypothetical protein